MKKVFIVMLALIPAFTLAQLKVDSIGHVSINNPTSQMGHLNIEQSSNVPYGIYLKSSGTALLVRTDNDNSSSITNSYGIKIYSFANASDANYGSYCRAGNSYPRA